MFFKEQVKDKKKRACAPLVLLEAPPSTVAEVVLHATSDGESTLCQGLLGLLKSLKVLLRATAVWPLFGIKCADVGHVGLERLDFVTFNTLHGVTSLLTKVLTSDYRVTQWVLYVNNYFSSF